MKYPRDLPLNLEPFLKPRSKGGYQTMFRIRIKDICMNYSTPILTQFGSRFNSTLKSNLPKNMSKSVFHKPQYTFALQS